MLLELTSPPDSKPEKSYNNNNTLFTTQSEYLQIDIEPKQIVLFVPKCILTPKNLHYQHKKQRFRIQSLKYLWTITSLKVNIYKEKKKGTYKRMYVWFNGHGPFCCLDIKRDSLILLIVFEPLRHNRADLNNEKDVFTLIHEMVFA